MLGINITYHAWYTKNGMVVGKNGSEFKAAEGPI
jgi:hypothetical protein